MLKQAPSGYADLVDRERITIVNFIPAVFVLSVLVLIVSAVRLDAPALLALPPLVWFIGVPIWDRIFGRSFERQAYRAKELPDIEGINPELGATTAGLATIGVLSVAATTDLSALSLLALAITGGVLLSLAAAPAIERRDGEFRTVGGYSGIRSWLFQGMLLLPVLNNNARCRHYHFASSQRDEGSARMGETYFAFLRRFIVGSFARSLTAAKGPGTETDDLTKLSCLGILFLCLAYGVGEIQLVLFVVGQASVALWQILAVEYVEHYGILCKKTESSSGIMTEHRVRVGAGRLNTVLLNGRVPHLSGLTDSDDEEILKDGELPYGFNALSMLVLWPSKWFALVDARLAESVNFDLHEVNLDGNAYVALMEKYHHPGMKPVQEQ